MSGSGSFDSLYRHYTTNAWCLVVCGSPVAKRCHPDELCHTLKQPGGGHLQRVIQDPIPFLILFGSILLMLWLWRQFKDR